MSIRLPNTHRLHALRMANDQRGYDMEEQRARFQGLATRHDDGTAPRAVVAYQLFQTPPALADQLVGLLGDITDARCLEPSAGLGRLLTALESRQCGEITAIEVEAQCVTELHRTPKPWIKVMHRDFLTVLPEDIGHFDFVAMNPPFHNRADIRHIRHALDFLRPGGRLAALMMDTPHRETAFRDEAAKWVKIPAGTFRTEGTGVGTILALFQQ